MASCTDVYLSGGEEQSLWYLFNISLLDNLQGPIILWVHYYRITSFQANVAAAVLLYHLSIHASLCSLWKRKFSLLSKEKVLDFFFFNIFYIIYFWLCWVFIAAHGLSLVWTVGATLHCSVRASHHGGFSCYRTWALGMWSSVVVARRLSSCGSWALECGLSSCGTWA